MVFASFSQSLMNQDIKNRKTDENNKWKEEINDKKLITCVGFRNRKKKYVSKD